MKYKAQVSTGYSTGNLESESKQECMDFIHAWMFELKIDPIEHRICNTDNLSSWALGGNFIICNFKIKDK